MAIISSSWGAERRRAGADKTLKPNKSLKSHLQTRFYKHCQVYAFPPRSLVQLRVSRNNLRQLLAEGFNTMKQTALCLLLHVDTF